MIYLRLRIIAVFISIFFVIIGAIAQIALPCTHQHLSKATEAFEKNDHTKSILHFDRFVNDGGLLNGYSLLKLARAYLEVGDTLNCIETLRAGIRKGLLWSEPQDFLSITHGFNEQQQSWLDTELIGFQENRKIFLDRLDNTLIQKINQLADQDQQVRLHRVFPNEEHTRLIHSTDSITLIELRSIFLKYDGFPPDSLLDRGSTFKLMTLIHHSYRTFPEQFDYLIPVVTNAINAFQLAPNEFAVMVDRRQYIIDRCSIYGEVPYHNNENISSLDNIQDLPQVDQLRYAVGLPSLRQYAIERGLALPDGYVELRSPCETH